MGSLWEQGLAAVRSYESQLVLPLPVAAIKPLASVPGDGGFLWVHMLLHTSAISML